MQHQPVTDNTILTTTYGVASPPPYKLSLAQYHQMLESGILATDRRYELIRGLVFEMMTIGPKHLYKVKRLEGLLEDCLKAGAIVFTQSPLKIPQNSEPQPDILVVKPPLEQYQERLPEVEDVLLIIEVSDSTLSYDRHTKARLYAEVGVPEYWILDVKRNQLEVNRQPDREQGLYREKKMYAVGEAISDSAVVACNLEWWT